MKPIYNRRQSAEQRVLIDLFVFAMQTEDNTDPGFKAGFVEVSIGYTRSDPVLKLYKKSRYKSINGYKSM